MDTTVDTEEDGGLGALDTLTKIFSRIVARFRVETLDIFLPLVIA